MFPPYSLSMKAKARLFKGIEFITVSELPPDQRMLIENSPTGPERIKILIEGKIVENCIQYSNYLQWYNTVFATAVPATKPKELIAPAKLGIKTA